MTRHIVGKAMCLKYQVGSDLEKRGRAESEAMIQVDEDGLGKRRLFILAMPVFVQVPRPIHVPRPKIVPFLTFVDLVQTTWIPGHPGVLRLPCSVFI